MTPLDLIMLFVSGVILGLIIGMEIGRARNNSHWKQAYKFNKQLLDILLESMLKGGRK